MLLSLLALLACVAYPTPPLSDLSETAPLPESASCDGAWFATHDADGFIEDGVLVTSVQLTNLGDDHMGYPGIVMIVDMPYAIDTTDWWLYGLFSGDTYLAELSHDLGGFPEDAYNSVQITYNATTLGCENGRDEDCVESCSLTCSLDDLLAGDCAHASIDDTVSTTAPQAAAANDAASW